MWKYLAKKFLYMLTVLIGILIVGFGIVYLTGDPSYMLAGSYADEAQVQAVRQSLGLDKPLIVQFITYISNIFKGDMGMSLRYNQPVFILLIGSLKNTYILAGASILVAAVAGLSMGVLAGINRGKFLDFLFTSFSVLGQSLPVFWTAIIFIMVFSVLLGWFPVSGMSSWKCIVLPAVTAGLFSAARNSAQTRSGIVDAMSKDYIRTARAKGLVKRQVIIKHALTNAMIPVVTMLGLELGSMLAGAVVTETIFAWPGIGQMMANAVTQRDYPLVRGGLIVVGFNFLIVNFLVEILYSIIDPRIRVE